MPAMFTKVDGVWLVKIDGPEAQKIHGTLPHNWTPITVSKRDGSTKSVKLKRIVSVSEVGGILSLLCAIHDDRQSQSSPPKKSWWDSQKFNGYGAKRGGYRRGCKTGGNCSSFGSGRSCGGHDCDGY